jgi:cell division control protein 24
MTAISLVEKETPNLMVSSHTTLERRALDTHLFPPQRANMSLTVPELTSFLVLPIQRLCRYPLLLEVRVSLPPEMALLTGSLMQKLSETVADTDYAFKSELADGLEVAKRIAEKVNETLRQHSNVSIVQELELRVKDWKGHHINDFGKLLLDGQFMVTKADMDRDYEVYLFEKMILCCKEVVPDKKDKKTSKSGSLLKKDRSANTPTTKRNMLNLKGRIYVNNLTHIQDVGSEGMC